MKVALCTSPHLDRSAYFDGRWRHHEGVPPKFAQTFLPMGLLSLAAAVKDLADVRIFDINKAINERLVPLKRGFYPEAAQAILAKEPDLVGFMTECDSFHHVARICASIKMRRPEVLLVLGCVHASYNAREILARYPFIDFVVRGEGEVAFRQLLTALKMGEHLSGVGSLSYRTADGAGSTAELPLIQDLDTLPWIDPELSGIEEGDAVWLEVGRGCPFKCNFCVTAPYWHRRHRIKSPERILDELRFFRDRYGRRDFNFTHDLFTTDRRWVLKFATALEKAELGVTWTCSSRTDTLDEEQLAAMARAGCRDIYFGIETGTAPMQSAIDKGLGLSESRRIIDLCHRYGVGTTVGFIAGLPGETRETLGATVREAADYLLKSRTTVHLFGFGPYRGSSGFGAIEERLVPEVNFVDFPVDTLTDVENRALVSAHRDVFARYSRLGTHSRTGFDRILQVAEEYLPLLNSVPLVVRYFQEAGVDPYEQLVAWAEWLQRRGTGTQEAGSFGGHLGTIEDYLDFLEDYASSLDISSDLLGDLLRWERVKQEFRSERPATAWPAMLPPPENGGHLVLNPTLRLEDFPHAPGLTSGSEAQLVPTFAFFRRRDGAASIVRIGGTAKALLEIAREQGNLQGVPWRQPAAERHDILQQKSDELVDAALDQLVSNEIMLRQ